MKKLVIEMLLCCMFGAFLGWYFSRETGKILDAEWKPVNSVVVYAGKWHRDGLEVVGR